MKREPHVKPTNKRLEEWQNKVAELEDFKKSGQIDYKTYQKEKRKLEKQKPLSGAGQVVFALVVLAIIGFICFRVFGGPSQSTAKIEAHLGSYRVTNPASITQEYTVTNTTDHAGKSSCDIEVYDSSRTYHGNDFGFESPNEIQPGESYDGLAMLTVTNEGASYITGGAISCKIE